TLLPWGRKPLAPSQDQLFGFSALFMKLITQPRKSYGTYDCKRVQSWNWFTPLKTYYQEVCDISV
ncbi:mCG145305, partial [Mus musculus]